MYQALTLSAGVAVDFAEQANFFRLLSAPQVDITLIFYKNGGEVSRAQNVGAGYAEKIDSGFDKLKISSTAGGAVAYVTRSGGDVRYDTPPNGNVTVTNTSGTITQTAPTVTSTAATLLALKAGRRYLLIQNNDATGIVYMNFSGTATVGAGIKIAPGGSFVADANYCPTNAISAISSIASQVVTVLEG